MLMALACTIRGMDGAKEENPADRRNINKIADGGDAFMAASAAMRKKAANYIFKLLRT